MADCEQWKDFRADTVGANAVEKLERMPELTTLEHQWGRTLGRMIRQARAELVDGGDHFDNYARQVDARCDDTLEQAGEEPD